VLSLFQGLEELDLRSQEELAVPKYQRTVTQTLPVFDEICVDLIASFKSSGSVTN